MQTFEIVPNSKLDMVARDIAILAAEDLYTPAEIFIGYELPINVGEALLANPVFQDRVAYHRTSVAADKHGLLRARAELMSSRVLRETFDIATSPAAKNSERLKAAAIILEMADAKPKTEQQFSGMVLNVNFGSGMPSVALSTDDGVIEHEQP